MKQYQLPLPQSPRELSAHHIAEMTSAFGELNETEFRRHQQLWVAMMERQRMSNRERKEFDKIRRNRVLMADTLAAARSFQNSYFADTFRSRCRRRTRLRAYWW